MKTTENKLMKLNKLKSEFIVAGDYNIDLLKINDKPIISYYFDTITSHWYFHKTPLSTRHIHYNGTLLGTFLCNLSSAGILISNISKHLPYFTSLNYV